MAALSKTCVFGRSLAGNVGSDPPGGTALCRVVCCVRVLCVGKITRPEESYRVWCVH
jgi:hypothetical protein